MLSIVFLCVLVFCWLVDLRQGKVSTNLLYFVLLVIGLVEFDLLLCNSPVAVVLLVQFIILHYPHYFFHEFPTARSMNSLSFQISNHFN